MDVTTVEGHGPTWTVLFSDVALIDMGIWEGLGTVRIVL